MRRRLIATLGLALASFITAQGEPARPELMPKEPLRNLKCVVLDIDEFLLNLLAKRGVGIDSVRSAIELDLAQVGISVQPDSSDTFPAMRRVPHLYLMAGILNCGATCTYSFHVELREPVTIDRMRGHQFEASTWHVRVDNSFEPCESAAKLRTLTLSAAHSVVMACERAGRSPSNKALHPPGTAPPP